ncbi:MAG: hypothetical protein CM1200mP41_29300 [Gammaproteobacteria bacterium]|nr:MAG: hypothetical protein CM1200mP41_29300 [Gammaproteobacteria bacterium]
MPISLTEYRVLYFCIVLLFVTGIVDDLRELPPAAKFVMQLIVALALVFLDEQLVRFVGDILDQSGPNEYEPLGLDILAIPLTVFAMLGVINAFNLIDGLDGLCGGITLIALAALMGLAFHHGGAVTEFKLLGIVLVTVAAFLIFNLSIWSPASLPRRRGEYGDGVDSCLFSDQSLSTRHTRRGKWCPYHQIQFSSVADCTAIDGYR